MFLNCPTKGGPSSKEEHEVETNPLPSRCRNKDAVMSKAKNGPGTGGRPRRDVLASLKMASMEEISRAALPAGELNLLTGGIDIGSKDVGNGVFSDIY